MSPRGASFELERFSLSPVTPDVSLVEVEGRLARAQVRARPPRLLVESASGARREHVPVEASFADGVLRASFTVPVVDAEDGDFALAVGGLLLDLPAPHPVPGADRTAALARELNVLRQEMTSLRDEAAEVRAAAEERQAEDEREREAERAALAAAEQEADERAAEAERQAAEHIAEAERAADERRADALRGAAKRQGELETAIAELQAALAAEQAEGERRDAAAAAERARLGDELDDLRDALHSVQEEARRALLDRDAAVQERDRLRVDRLTAVEERDAARAAATQATPPPVREVPERAWAGDTLEEAARDPDDTLEAPADDELDDTEETGLDDPVLAAEHFDEDVTTVEGVAPADEPTTVAPLRAAHLDPDEPEEPEDTGPVPLRRGVPTRGRVAAVRAPLPPPEPKGAPGWLGGVPPRTVALAVLGLALLLLLVAILGVVL